MRYEDLSRLILSVCEDYVALEIIAEAVHREASYLINRVIPRMLEDGLLERLYPSSPKHPLQKISCETSRKFIRDNGNESATYIFDHNDHL